MLQIVSKAVDPSADQNREALGIDFGYFASQNKSSVPPPNSFPQDPPPINVAQGAPPPQSFPPQASPHNNFGQGPLSFFPPFPAKPTSSHAHHQYASPP
eukprot:7656337-Ditylum_brightwellii.AAC.1